MNQFVLQTDGGDYTTSGTPVDLSIPLRFDGPQPGFFAAGDASARPMYAGEFIGDTRLGGSCNAERLDLIPHCNGTHTECLGHISKERVSIHDLATDALYLAVVVTIETVAVGNTGEQAGPASRNADRLITGRALADCVSNIDTAFDALVVRTMPNDPAKAHRNWIGEESPYFTVEAMNWIVDNGVRHLLVDAPSVDRLDDGGHLAAHRIFWGMEPGSKSAHHATRAGATITELIYVPDQVEDGLHLLDLQIAPFVSDAAPSRPLLYRIA